ncbi:hypothetical protein OG474_07460 [Kribbella sp. NBC_01505]|uniref:hypothetical protein n=1 Tax=Kribbella sp. NBC_01505 TaxID=2903580 RepID=UPI003869FD46
MSWGTVELEPEVRDWLEALSAALFARTQEIARARRAYRRCVERAHGVPTEEE